MPWDVVVALYYYMYDHTSCCVGSSINLGKLISLLGLLLAWQFAAISPTSIPLLVSRLVWVYYIYRPVHLLASFTGSPSPLLYTCGLLILRNNKFT